MKRRALRIFLFSLFSLVLVSVVFLGIASTRAKTVARISAVLDVASDAALVAVLPDVPAFLAKLRGGSAMRGFFDSALGAHFLRSAPLRSAGYLHRLISLAPRSWQWNLYALLTDGPVFYRSDGNEFTLVVALNKKGQALTALMGDAAAARHGDYLVIASDKKTLERQLAYMAKPSEQSSQLDAALTSPSALSVMLRLSGDQHKGLGRALLRRALQLSNDSRCRLMLQPEGESIGLSGECSTPTVQTIRASHERISMPDFPAHAYFRLLGQDKAYLIALGGFESDYGYLVPRLHLSGPMADQKMLEFFSQAFKTRNHQLEKNGQAIQIRYPYPYAYSEKKYDLFAPYLYTDRDRFLWYSFLTNDRPREIQLELKPEYSLYLSAKLFPLLQASEKALRQFDAIYSPGHFHEFRDALFKSTATLKQASIKFFAKPEQGGVRIGGALSFADI